MINRNKSLTTIEVLLMRGRMHSEYTIKGLPGVTIGCNYDVNFRYGNNCVIVFTDNFKEIMLLDFYDGKIFSLYSTFPEDMNNKILDILSNNIHAVSELVNGFHRALDAIKLGREILSKDK